MLSLDIREKTDLALGLAGLFYPMDIWNRNCGFDEWTVHQSCWTIGGIKEYFRVVIPKGSKLQ